MTILGVVTGVAWTFLSTVLLYAGYLAYCTANAMRKQKVNGVSRLSTLPWLVRGYVYAIVYSALILDIALNVTLGSLVFVEMPEPGRLTCTARCSKWLFAELETELDVWRYKVALYVCEGWLNPFEANHCR